MSDPVKEIFNDLYQRVDYTSGLWAGYIYALKEAYAAAYSRQEYLLTRTKTRIEARKKQEDQDRVMVLSMLTAGTFGIFATHFSHPTAVAATNIAKTAKDTVGSNQNWQDAALEAAGIKSPQLASEPYVPAGVTPEQYGAALQSGLQNRINLLKGLTLRWKDNSGEFSEINARDFSSSLKNQDFFTKAPPEEITPSIKQILELRSKLALWIAWGLERDKKYWSIQSALRFYGPQKNEVYDWKDVRDELIAIQVPEAVVCYPDPLRGTKFASGAMNMEGFLTWVSSPNALEALFWGLNHDDDGMRWVRNRWKQKLKVETDPFPSGRQYSYGRPYSE